ncbi:hypothetical protein I6E52_03275 [Salinibacterium sp. NG253]|uniref:hypothetical protein n=1 Tax=Salinibacterium sp. NG253 TaxID=2792039 RepID=UPI0018CE1767|nr:hypothetical protein [Salinibacterium sp. NG253]MBH0115860.1 hypothetical protein [Salinibacterium sp. NG253]
MISSKRASALLMAPAVLLVLSGCALIEPADTSEPPTAMELCAMGHTWTLDTADLAEKLLAELPSEDVPAKAVEPSGGQTLTWESTGALTIDSDLVFTISAEPKSDQVMTITRSYTGTVVGKALINVDVAIPRDWDVTDYTIDTTAVLADEPVEELKYTIPRSDFDDKLGLIITCEADVMTVNPRGTSLIQVWNKVS